jgi:flagellar biosynthesis chaperone FliJ
VAKMQDKEKEEWDGELKNLYQEKDQLEDQIRMLDKEKN